MHMCCGLLFCAQRNTHVVFGALVTVRRVPGEKPPHPRANSLASLGRATHTVGGLFFFYFFPERPLPLPPSTWPSFPSYSLSFPPPPSPLPNPTPLNQSPLFSFHSGPSGLSEGDRVPTKLQERATDFLHQFEKFRYLFPRCQLAWLSWQQQSFYDGLSSSPLKKPFCIEKNTIFKKKLESGMQI